MLDELLQKRQIWRAGDIGGQDCTLSTGYPELDRSLPGGGWPRAALTEVLLEGYGLGELRLVLPALVRLASGSRIVWIAPPLVPYAPALAAAGLDPGQLVFVQPQDTRECLWAAEQSLRSGVCAAVLVWIGEVDGRWLRRLQLAAEYGRSWGVVFRPDALRRGSSPAALRMRLCTGVPPQLAILKSRGGRPRKLPLMLDPMDRGSAVRFRA